MCSRELVEQLLRMIERDSASMCPVNRWDVPLPIVLHAGAKPSSALDKQPGRVAERRRRRIATPSDAGSIPAPALWN